MIELLANATPPDPMISGDWVLKLIGAIFTGAALILGRYWGKKEAASESNVTLKKPVPTIQTREEPQWATKPDLDDHKEWTREEFQRVWGQFGTERELDDDKLGKIHLRINQQSEATAALKGSVEKISENVTQLLNLALHGKTPTRRQ